MIAIGTKTKPTVEPLDPREAVPSNWIITGKGDDSLYAINSYTQREFTGRIADFNKMLKG